jgi:type I restriction enzyme, S subunit
MNALNLNHSKLPDGWAIATLPSFADIIMGQSPPSETYNTTGEGLPFFQGKAEFGAIYPTIEKYCSEPNKVANQGDILLSVRAPVGPTNIAAVKCCIGRGLAAIHPWESINSKFILYLFRALEPQISKEGTGSIFKAINKQFIEDLTVALPPLNEQHHIIAKIEELFSELDQGIENLRTARQQLKVYRQALLKYAFDGKLTERWRKVYADQLETTDQLLARIKKEQQQQYQHQVNEWKQAIKVWEDNGKQGTKPRKPQKPKYIQPLTEQELGKLPILPDEWCWVKLSFLAENIQIGPFGSLLHKSDYTSNGVPLINPTHIKNQRIEPDWSLSVSQEKLSKLSSFIMRAGDIVIGRRGEMGRCAVVTQKEDGFVCGTGSLFIRLLPENNSYFYCYILSSQQVKDFLSDQSIGTTMQNLNQEILHNVPVPLCAFSEQKKIIEEIESKMTVLLKLENTIEENLQKAEVLRQSILKKAFSGDLVPADPNDEPANNLLERIRAERETAPKPTFDTFTTKIKQEKATMLNLISVLESEKDWLNAKYVFRQCGIGDGAETEAIEKVYLQLRDFVKQERIQVERRGDEDWLRISSIEEE